MSTQLRQATPRDVDALAKLKMLTNMGSELFQYRHPWAAEYPDDLYRSTVLELSKQLRNDEKKWHIIAVETSGTQAKGEIIGYAVWQVDAIPELRDIVPQDSTGAPEAEPSQNRSSDAARTKAWKLAMGEFRKQHMNVPWGPYLHLQYIGTHPGHRRQGHAKALLQWGMDLADAHRLRIGLFGTTSGRLLYEANGFHALGNVVIRAEGQDTAFNMLAVGREPTGDKGV